MLMASRDQIHHRSVQPNMRPARLDSLGVPLAHKATVINGQRTHKFESLRLQDECAGRRDDVLGVAAVPLREGEHAEHLVTRLVDGDAQADGLHRSRDIPPEHERWLAYEYATLPSRYVDRVHPAACTRMTISPMTGAGIGTGIGTSMSLTSVPPSSFYLMACIVSFISRSEFGVSAAPVMTPSGFRVEQGLAARRHRSRASRRRPARPHLEAQRRAASGRGR